MDILRRITALIFIPVMLVTGFRFNKDYRHETTKYHAFIYACVDTVGANIKCFKLLHKKDFYK